MSYYLIIKSLHIIAVIAWMAGMLYLPRLFVYHAKAGIGTEASEMLKLMEKRLLRYIINPAMIATYIFGIILIMETDAMKQGWLHAKLTLVGLLTVVHILLARHRKAFDRDENTRSQKYFRILNEVPTMLMIVIVFLAILKPF